MAKGSDIVDLYMGTRAIARGKQAEERYKSQLQTQQQLDLIKALMNLQKAQESPITDNQSSSSITNQPSIAPLQITGITGKSVKFGTPKLNIQTNELTKVKNQLNNVQSIRNLLTNQPSGPLGGFISKIGQYVTGGQLNPEAKLYNDDRPAFAAGLYKDLSGDNRLSDRDASRRALPLLPDQQEARNMQQLKFNFIEQALQNRIKLLETGQTVDPEKAYQDLMNDFTNQVNQLNKGTSAQIGKYRVVGVQ